MRILAVGRRFPPDVRTGRAVAFARLVGQLRGAHEVRLVAGWRRDRAAIPDDALGVDLRSRGPVAAHAALWRAIRSAVRRFDPQVVISASVDVPLIPRPTIALVRDLEGTGWGEDAMPRDRWHRWRARRFDRLVVPGHATERALLRAGHPAARVVAIPDLVGAVAPARASRPDGPLRVVHPGRMLPAKQQHLSIEAVARLPPEIKQRLELHVVGEASDRGYFDQLRVAGRDQPVRFHADVEDIGAHVAAADLVLYPTALRQEWPDVAIEAMAQGVPVAWTDHPAVREATGGHGRALPVGDFDALRAVLRELVRAPDELRATGEAGRRFVDANYTWRQVGPRWQAILGELGR